MNGFGPFIAYHLETKLMPILASMHQQFATSDRQRALGSKPNSDLT